MKEPPITPPLPETDGWDEASKEHPRIQWIHRLFIAAAIFFAVVIAALAGLYFWPVSIKPSKDYEYHVKRFEYWFKKDKTGQKLEIRYGKEKRWNADGKLVWQRNWSNDTWDGWEKEWYETGQLRNEQAWRDGKKNGSDKYWHANGKLWRETRWENDVQQGEALAWDENGKPVEEPKTARTLDLGDGVKLEMMEIPAGEFLMGSEHSAEETAKWAQKWWSGVTADSFKDEHPQHKVKITQPFFLGKFEVTQEQYEKIMGANPSEFKGKKNPVECVSWDDAVAFCQKLSQKTGEEIRLPTEAEWEYSCRAGSTTRYYFGDEDTYLRDYAWYGYEHSNKQTHPVGQKIPNAFGLYDMSGNVWEWCNDRYDENYYKNSPADDPKGASQGSSRVVRGGGWGSNSLNCRSAGRYGCSPGDRYSLVGFRVCVRRTPE